MLFGRRAHKKAQIAIWRAFTGICCLEAAPVLEFQQKISTRREQPCDLRSIQQEKQDRIQRDRRYSVRDADVPCDTHVDHHALQWCNGKIERGLRPGKQGTLCYRHKAKFNQEAKIKSRSTGSWNIRTRRCRTARLADARRRAGRLKARCWAR